ncbi:DUF4097 family beta strand repeat-containing protein [Streptomyces sp. x-80]|uniref:DUF4097 family beta strand repeat-containing protein n=1 Tax=Streptomyces sp. x-80 TaxID=2789282 RepID=UPI0039810794
MERTFTSPSTGPVVLGLALPMGSIRVQVRDNVTTARIVLRTDDASGPAADALTRARSGQDGQAITVEVPEIPGDVMMQSIRGTRVTQSMGTVHGSVTGLTIINGRVVSGGGTGTITTVSPIEATVLLPARSSLAVVTRSADTVISGGLDGMEFRSVSGNLHLVNARRLKAITTSGDVLVGSVTDRLSARSVSGDLTVDMYAGSAAELETTSGDIDVLASSRASNTLYARTISGDIRVGGNHALRVNAHSRSGNVRTR